MSGFAGVVHAGGGRPDPEALRRMASALAFRGPDGVTTRTAGPAAFAFALLRTSDASSRQPATLDGRSWLVADARLDGRDELADALRAAGRTIARAAPDAELLLYAYSVWGERLPEHVQGDFAFALWDADRRRLFCARDRFGVKLLYHARAGGAVIFGNTPDAVRAHPGVGRDLNETAVADFLVFGYNPDPAATSLAAVSALPPAHRMTVEADGEVRIGRYWELPREPEALPCRRPGEYVEAFLEVFGRAVRDRAVDRSAVLLSGGRDSGAVAATALAAPKRARPRLSAHTLVYDRLIPDQERHWSQVAASALGIPIRHHEADGYGLMQGWDDPALRRPEPHDNPLPALDADFYAAVAADARVALTGDGGDPALAESRSRLARLLAGGRVAAAAREAAVYARLHRRLPRPGFRTLRRDRRGEGWLAPLPEWLDEGFVRESGYRERWEALRRPPASDHPYHPEAHARLSAPYWSHWFEQYDAGFTRLPLEFRHPFFDARLASFLLSIPPAQWYNDKGLLRIGMRGRLPERLLARPKTPLAGDPVAARLEARGWSPPPLPPLSAAVERWVDPRHVPVYAGGSALGVRDDPGQHFRPLELSVWLEQSHFTI